MNIEQARDIVRLISSMWGDKFQQSMTKDRGMLWRDALCPLDYHLSRQAVKAIAAEQRYPSPPSIDEFVAAVRALKLQQHRDSYTKPLQPDEPIGDMTLSRIMIEVAMDVLNGFPRTDLPKRYASLAVQYPEYKPVFDDAAKYFDGPRRENGKKTDENGSNFYDHMSNGAHIP